MQPKSAAEIPGIPTVRISDVTLSLPDADDTAVDAFTKIRRRSRS